VLPAQAAPEPQLEAAYREVVGIASVGGAVLRTRVLRPQGQGPFPVAIISHGSPADPAQRPVMVPTFAALSNWLLQRGYVAALPLRRGYGETMHAKPSLFSPSNSLRMLHSRSCLP
jgi:hypothetical protein